MVSTAEEIASLTDIGSLRARAPVVNRWPDSSHQCQNASCCAPGDEA